MKEHSIRPMRGLPPAERAVKYILDILPLYPELSYYLCPGTNMLNLLCDAEAHRLGIEPDPEYQGFLSSRFAEEYACKLKPKDPKEGLEDCPECKEYLDHVCPGCGWKSREEA